MMAILGWLVSCSSDETSSTACSSENLVIPTITVSCSKTGNATDCVDNSADGRQFFAFWMPATSDCNGFKPNSTAGAYYVRNKGTVKVSCDSSACTGSVSSWVDKNDADATTMTGGNVKACVYIDTDSDGAQDTGEPVKHEGLANYTSCSTVTSQALTGFFNATNN